MSAVLGPIHVKMYSRVLYQDELAQSLLAMAEEKGWADGLRQSADSKAPAASKEPLETLIDPDNIHGWLSGAVARCERRFAIIAGGILKDNPERMPELQAIMRRAGEKYPLPKGCNAEQAFGHIHNTLLLLDGMPCDFPFGIVESSERVVSWRVNTCPHSRYWTEQGHHPEDYYYLRDAWVDGVLKDSEFSHSRAEGKHTLRKE